MKKNCLIVIFMLWMTCFSQEIDSLSITYYIGHDCSYTIDSKTLRGGCEKRETIQYSKRKNRYRISSHKFEETFREWKEGFQPNLVQDSSRNLKNFSNWKIDAKSFNDFMVAICSINSNTVFPYELQDVPVYKDAVEKKQTTKAETDSILKSSFLKVKFSSVVTILNIRFNYGGERYVIEKSVDDAYWTIYFPGDENKIKRFIYFDFDAFLVKNLPKKFFGLRVLTVK